MAGEYTRTGHKVWRALDQSVAFFGIKGRFMILFLLIAAVAVVIGLAIGSNFGSLFSTISIGVMLFADYMITTAIQAKLSEREFSRLLTKNNMPRYIRFRPADVCSLLNSEMPWK